METEKNLHASIPPALLAAAEKAATTERISVDEWIRAAMERSLIEQRRNDIFAYGKQQAQKLGIKEEDVDRIIHEFREEERAGRYQDDTGRR